MALPRTKAQWRSSAPAQMMQGPVIEAVGATTAEREIQTFSPRFSNSLSGSDGPS
jgi:hypothetical protein